MDEENLLKQVFDEIERLQHETFRLSCDASKQIEDNWHHNETWLVPLVNDWRVAIGAAEVAAYTLKNAELTLIPKLSSSNVNSPKNFNIDEPYATQTDLDKQNYQQIRLAIGSLDLHMDFARQNIFVPLSIGDSACGIIIACVPGLTKDKYAGITHDTSAFVEKFRTEARNASPRQQTQVRAS